MKRELPNTYPGQECFFCGEKNPIGLKLKFFLDESRGEVSTDFRPSRLFAGLGNILHGGLQAGLFDEIMGWATHSLTGEPGVTSKLNLEFLKPVYLESPLRVTCRIVSREGNRVQLAAEIRQSEEVVNTKATGTYHLMTQEKFDRLAYGSIPASSGR